LGLPLKDGNLLTMQSGLKLWLLTLAVMVLCGTGAANAQAGAAVLPAVESAATVTTLPDAPAPAITQHDAPAANNPPQASPPRDSQEGQQSKRILFIVPNFRAVSVDAKLPPLKPWEKFKLAAADSFDYSSFIYVGMLAGVAQAEDSTPEFHQGAAGYARYYWHSFADNTDGNFFTEAIVPSFTHEDPRYYTLGRGGLIKRTVYAFGRLVVTRTDSGGRSFNYSEIIGNGAAAGIADLYYPAPERTFGKTADKWVLQIGLDGASNFLKEFWPDIAHGLFRQAKVPPATQ
jgi:hypothetical protein